MNIEREIEDLASQVVALDAIIIALCQHFSKTSPGFGNAVRAAFDDAANHTETIGFIVQAAPPQHFTKAVRIIGELRTAIFGNQQKPSDIV
jgi:hypothetical protein